MIETLTCHRHDREAIAMPSSRIPPSKALVKRTLMRVTSLAFAAILSFAPSGGVAMSETTTITTPLLAALAYAPLDTELIKFEFTDWAALKAMHGGELVTSASPIEDRQALLLDISHTEASPLPLGFDRTLRAGSWGFDSTDLLWEAVWHGSNSVLRVREDWDPTPPAVSPRRTRLHTEGSPLGISYAFERPTIEDRSAPLSLTISSDRRMLVLGSFDGRQVLGTAARADPDVVAATPFGRVATALGQPLAASIRDGVLGCLGTGTEDLHLYDDAAALIESVGPLDSYEAYGAGYERASPGEPAVGR
jgi:hypothetical protein